MGSFVVFNNVDWVPPVQSKFLTPPKLKIAVSFPDNDLKEMVDKQRKTFDAEFKKFDADFHKLGTAKIKAVQEAIKWTEERIAQKGSKEEKQEVVATANKMLEQAFKVFQGEIQTLAQKHYDGAVEKSIKVMKGKLTKAHAKAIVKIIIVAGLTLTAAGLAIAASVATGGLLVPLIIGAIVAGASALASAYKTVKDGWSSAENQIKTIEKDIATLKEATKKLVELKRLGTADPKKLDVVKKFAANITGKTVELDKHVGQLDKYIFQVSQGLKKQTEDLTKMTDSINKSGNDALKAKANALMRDIMLAVGSLRAMEDVQQAAAAANAEWKSNQTMELGKFETALKKIASATPFLIAVGTGAKAVYDGASSLKK